MKHPVDVAYVRPSPIQFEMQCLLSSLGFMAVLAHATPLFQRDTTDTATDWDGILNGDSGATCSDLAIIFARGTFDSGNIGPWVGGPFRDALVALHSGTAFQGVNPNDYAADLAGYIDDGSPQSCADSLANSVRTYYTACPDAKFVISGWSQGALCAHKSLGSLGDAASSVIAVTTFGDPIDVWTDSITFPSNPSNAQSFTYCKQSPIDPLCQDPSDDTFSSDSLEFIDDLKDIWENASSINLTDDQKSAFASIVTELPEQASDQITQLATDIANGDIRRWELTPQHFWYGDDGTVQQAAIDIMSAFGS
ncbi:alpha/beta-hydrolase [Xylariaceae sp. FL0255]|nr:alpha/beta-hydrolase [Xylariaceae sp. FL0255]